MRPAQPITAILIDTFLQRGRFGATAWATAERGLATAPPAATLEAMTRTHILAVLALAATLLVAAPLAADQNDPRLDALFRELAGTDSEIAAVNAEREIWAIWLEVEDADAARATAHGVRLLQLARLDAAEAAFSRAIEAAPRFAEAWNKRATVRFLQGDHDGSVADIRRTLELEPRHFGALSGLAMIYEQRGDAKGALAGYEAALRLNPHLERVRDRVRVLRRRVEGDPI
jgi:tetratricopeptide (TPR) repeat protein